MRLDADQLLIAWQKAVDTGREDMVTAAATVENIKSVPIGTLPATETQCRSLTHLTADQQLIPPHGFMQGY